MKEIQYKIASVKLSKEAMRELSDELASVLGTPLLGLDDEDDPDTLVLEDSSNWFAEARVDRARKCYRLHSYPSDDHAIISDSDYEYRIDGTRVCERLLYDSFDYYGEVEERVKDNIVLAGRLDAEALSRFRSEVEWHEVPPSKLKYFVLSRHPEVLPRLECRRFLRQELERLRFGVAEQRRKAADIGAELHEENGVYDLRFPEGAGGADWDSIRKLVTAESLAGVGLTPAEFSNAGSLMASLDRILGSE
ncbi:MAG TPA: hypothetical protein VFC29_14510 [Candidatus Limnocylindrales bacterium]|nr:hypothetical protein [Candidatus Limnocylindrales bacterium]